MNYLDVCFWARDINGKTFAVEETCEIEENPSSGKELILGIFEKYPFYSKKKINLTNNLLIHGVYQIKTSTQEEDLTDSRTDKLKIYKVRGNRFGECVEILDKEFICDVTLYDVKDLNLTARINFMFFIRKLATREEYFYSENAILDRHLFLENLFTDYYQEALRLIPNKGMIPSDYADVCKMIISHTDHINKEDIIRDLDKIPYDKYDYAYRADWKRHIRFLNPYKWFYL